MRRRKLVALVGLMTLVVVVVVALISVGLTVGTNTGREQVRRMIQTRVAAGVDGKVHIGRVNRLALTGLELDSFAIRGPDDSILVSTGRVRLEYNPRDLSDFRLHLKNVEVEHPIIRLRQHVEGDWNFQRIFRSKDDRPATPELPGRGFGDYVILDSVTVTDGTFLLTRPWEPDDSLSGVKRDSAIHRNLTNPNREIRRSAEGLIHTYRWSEINGFLPHVRIAHPDSSRFGQEFIVERLSVNELEPPFQFSNGRGVVRKQGDSVFVDIAHFDLPRSTGSAVGKIWWGSGLPIRVDVNIDADSVSLSDVAWVYETLPRVGGGKTKLRIRNNPANLHDFRYELTEMDVRADRSRLLGAMTFVVGGPVLEVVDVDLQASPVNFDLVRTLAGEELPVDWQGDLTGYVKGPGGPLTQFVVDESDVTFTDAHVRGAVSRASGRGMLDILDPELTRFLGFDLNVASLDLRSVQYLFPSFLELGGTVAGTVTLDSSWLDVRFSNANVTHRRGAGTPSRMTGRGRVTYGEDFMRYDLDVRAEPVSLTMLSRAYPLRLQGLMRGPIRATGTTDSLRLVADLEGPAGRVQFDGVVDAYPLSVAATGVGRVESLDVQRLTTFEKAPQAQLTGDYTVAVRVDTSDFATLTGEAALQIERAEVDSIRIFPSSARVRFADRRMYVDTLRIESTAARVAATGALSMADRSADSLEFQIAVDSVGGLRRYVSRFLPATVTTSAPDSLGGSIVVSGVARGALRSPDVTGTVTGSSVFIRREAGREIVGSFALADIFGAPTGDAALRFSSLNIGGIALDTLGITTRFDAGRTGGFRVGALAVNGVTLGAAGTIALGDRENDVVLRELNVVTGDSRWGLRGPAHIHTRDRDVTIDSIALVNQIGSRIWLAGSVPERGNARVFFRADSVPLRDVGRVAQTERELSGFASFGLQGSGTRDAPAMRMQLRMHDLRYGGFGIERVTGLAEYRAGRTEVSLDLARGGRNVVFARGSLPIELRYFGASLLPDSLTGSIRTDSASLDLIAAFLPLERATGTLAATIDIRGTWDHPDVAGAVRVENGEATVTPLNVRLRGINADIALFGHSDSLAIRRLVAWSGTGPADSASLTGYIAYRDLANPYFGLRLNARNFSAIDRRTIARLAVSTEADGIRLRGPYRGATLSGGLVVDRGTIYLPDPEVARKRQVDLSWQFADTVASVRQLVPPGPSRLMESLLMEDVRVTLGDEVRLASAEADIKLTGSLTVQRVPERVSSLAITALDADSVRYRPLLEGVLRAERGTYRLALGPVIQREFIVEGGTITFIPVAGVEPELNISALHTVRAQTSEQSSEDLRVRVRLSGPLAAPIVSLESAESFALSQSDLVSYLIFGQPQFALGTQQEDYYRLALQTILPTVSVGVGEQLRRWLGGLADVIELRPGVANTSVFFGQNTASRVEALENFVYSSRIAAEYQLTDQLFLSASTPICGLTDQNLEFIEGLSGRIEWRLSSDASLRAGKEPSATALLCRTSSGGQVVSRTIQAPSQWGLSLFKTWRF